MPEKVDVAEQVSRVVGLALRERKLASLEEMLRGVAQLCGGFGVALWRQRRDMRDACLFVLAHGFNDSTVGCAFHELRADQATSQCLNGVAVEVADCASDDRIDKDNPFYRRERPGSLVSLPVTFRDSVPGAITLYRRAPGVFSPDTQHLFSIFADQVGNIYDTIIDRVSYDLVQQISHRLDIALDEPEPVSARQTLEEICQDISKALYAREVSIFLEGALEKPDVIQCQATTCAGLLRQTDYRRDESGFTPYVWRERAPLLVVDVLHSEESLLQATRWRYQMGLEAAVRRELDLSDGEATPAVSIAAVPIPSPDRVLGVLRCHLRQRTPYYFAESDLALLQIVASRIGFFWARRLRRLEDDASRRSWIQFVDRLNRLSYSIRGRSVTAAFEIETKERIYQEALQAIRSAIQGLDVVDISLVDFENSRISTAAILGATRPVTMPLTSSAQSFWALVYKQKEVLFVADAGLWRNVPDKELYPLVKQALFIPVMAEQECIGVVSLRSFGAIVDLEKAKRMGALLALVVSQYELVAMRWTPKVGQNLAAF